MLAPIHDAILFEYPVEKEQETLTLCKKEMVKAGRLFLKGYRLLVDEEARVEFPERYPPGDQRIWDLVMEVSGKRGVGS